ncbi:hypothetical protein NKG94_03470 [Micromonospora sp. M12]
MPQFLHRHREVRLREALEEATDADLAHDPGQRGAEAVMDTVPERQVTAGVAVDVELVAVLELPGSWLATPSGSTTTVPLVTSASPILVSATAKRGFVTNCAPSKRRDSSMA